MKIFIVLIFLLNLFLSYGQTGTNIDPFTSLNQSAKITSSGIYVFKISGEPFVTYVDANGYVQIAIDWGNGSADLP